MGVAVLAFAVGVARKGERTLKGDMKAFIAALPPSSEFPLPLLPPSLSLYLFLAESWKPRGKGRLIKSTSDFSAPSPCQASFLLSFGVGL